MATGEKIQLLSRIEGRLAGGHRFSRIGIRTFDIVLSLGLVLALSPVWVIVFFARKLNGSFLQKTVRIGFKRKPFRLFSLDDEFSVAKWIPGGGLIGQLPVLFNILRGEMSFVGPRPLAPGEMRTCPPARRIRFGVRPGLVSLWWIRKKGNIHYESEFESDIEYVENKSFWGDLGILLRAVFVLFYGAEKESCLGRLRILGISIHNLSMDEGVESIVRKLEGSSPKIVSFVNADCANIAWRDRAYRKILNSADLVFADGIGMKLGGKILGTEIRQNVNGTDLFPRLCGVISGTGKRVFLLGGKPGVAEDVQIWLREHFPQVQVSGFRNGYISREEEADVVRRIAESGADLLLVAMGAPMQEKWIAKNIEKTRVKVAMGVGGLFDFYSGQTPRAPIWVRELGMEWVYRFYQEPRRLWRRYLVGNILFLYRVMESRRKILRTDTEEPG